MLTSMNKDKQTLLRSLGWRRPEPRQLGWPWVSQSLSPTGAHLGPVDSAPRWMLMGWPLYQL